MVKEDIVIFGTSKVAEIVYSCILNDPKSAWNPIAFTVDGNYRMDDEKFGLPVVDFETVEEKYSVQKYKMIVAMGYHGMNAVRARKCSEAKEKGYRLASFIHSGADVPANVVIGENTIILNNVSIGPFAKVGNGVCIYNGATVSHHAEIGNNVWITSGTVIGGNSNIGDNCFLGINSTVGHNIRIGKGNFIGAGAIVTKNTEEDSVYILSDTPKYRLDAKRFTELFKFD